MLKTFFATALILLLTSCQEVKKHKYSTDTLDCLNALLDEKNNSNPEETIKLLTKHEEKFKFAADLKATFSDRAAISKAQSSASKGKLTEAKQILEKRIAERGFSEVLEQSIENIDRSVLVKKYIDGIKNMEIGERARELAQLKAHTAEAYKDIKEYDTWLKEETERLTKQAAEDKKLILESLKFTKDFMAVHKPDLLETILLQTSALENEILLPGYEDKSPKTTTKTLKRMGVKGAIYNSYSTEGKSLKDFAATGIPSLQKQLAHTHLLAKAGQISKTLESLQELQDLCGIEEKYRRSILKQLFLAKGWNDASLINRDFLDISSLLETVYKANQ